MISTPPKPATSIKRRWLWRAVILLVSFVMAGAAYWWWTNSRIEREWRQVVSEIDAVEEDWRLQDLDKKRAMIPPHENLGDQMVGVAGLVGRQMMDHGSRDEVFRIMESLGDARLLAHEKIALLEDVGRGMPNYGKIRAEANKLGLLVKGNVPLRQPSQYLFLTSSTEAEANYVEYFLRTEAILNAYAGRGDLAAADALAQVKLIRIYDDSPSDVDHILAFSRMSRQVSFLQFLLALDAIPEPSLAALQSALEEDDRFPRGLLYAKAARAEAASIGERLLTGRFTRSDTALVRSALGSKGGKSWWRDVMFHVDRVVPDGLSLAEVEELRRTHRLVNEKKEPLELQARRYRASFADVPMDVPYSSLTVEQRQRRRQAYDLLFAGYTRCGIVALAAERFRRKHDRWPSDVDSLVKDRLLDRPVIDPWSGEPIRLRKTDDGLWAYLVGMDGEDQPERIAGYTPNQLMPAQPGFRLWNPAARRQPPLPDDPP